MSLTEAQLEVKIGRKRIILDDIARIIADLPEKVKPAAARHVAEFYVKRFRLYPRYKLVRRATAYPNAASRPTGPGASPGWFSAKQRRYVMARIREGTIKPGVSHRTMEAKKGWAVTGQGATLTIRNPVPYAGWLYSDAYQARQPGLVGWQKVGTMREENADDAFADLVDFIDAEIIKIFKRI